MSDSTKCKNKINWFNNTSSFTYLFIHAYNLYIEEILSIRFWFILFINVLITTPDESASLSLIHHLYSQQIWCVDINIQS